MRARVCGSGENAHFHPGWHAAKMPNSSGAGADALASGDEWLSELAAAAYLGVSVDELRRRSRERGIPRIVLGPGARLYYVGRAA